MQRFFSKGIFKDITKDSDLDRFEPLDTGYSGPAIVGIKENTKRGLPAILFVSKDKDIPMNAGVSNTNYFHNSRCIYISAGSEIALEEESSRRILDLTISILDDAELERVIAGYER